MTDKSEVQESDERMCELTETQAVVSAENKTDDLDEMSQFIDDGLRDKQWSDTSDIARVVEHDMYTLEQINYFLDETKGKTGVEVRVFILDLE